MTKSRSNFFLTSIFKASEEGKKAMSGSPINDGRVSNLEVNYPKKPFH
ncbi:MAG: hypothetical protein WAP14_02340 [Acetomicrobium sp.]